MKARVREPVHENPCTNTPVGIRAYGSALPFSTCNAIPLTIRSNINNYGNCADPSPAWPHQLAQTLGCVHYPTVAQRLAGVGAASWQAQVATDAKPRLHLLGVVGRPALQRPAAPAVARRAVFHERLRQRHAGGALGREGEVY